MFEKFKDDQRDLDSLKWGDEVEYHVVKTNPDLRTVKVWAEGYEAVAAKHEQDPVEGFDYHHEFGSWMAEAVPQEPYS